MRTPPHTTTTKADRTRLMVIDKAAVLFNQKGFSGTSIQDILAATGLSKGGLYGHFEGKEEIAIAGFLRAVERVREEVSAHTRPFDSSLDKLKAVVYFYRERILTPPVEGGCPIQNTAVEVDDTFPELREKVIDVLDEWQERIVKTLHRGIERGEVRPDINARDFAAGFIAQIEGGILLSRLYRDIAYFEIIAQQIITSINHLKPEKP